MKATARRMISDTVEALAHAANIDLQELANKHLGILQWQNSTLSGEDLLIGKILPKVLTATSEPAFLDIGANEGDYTARLVSSFPQCCIHCFEPVPSTAERLRARFQNIENVKIINSAATSGTQTVEIFDYENSSGSSHASLYKEVLIEQHRATTTSSTVVEGITLDDYCSATGLSRVHLLKLDTEGHELAVLEGAINLIRDEAIGMVQFEFNEMNVISRTFLRDFYAILPRYSFYRLRRDGLIALGDYSPKNEVFQFQNILAVRRDLAKEVQGFVIRRLW